MADSSERWETTRRTSWVARVLGPLALLAVVVAVIVVVSSSMNGDEGATGSGSGNGVTGTTEEVKSKKDKAKDGPETPREYVVEAGDSFSTIADDFGVSVKRLERLNPDVDANALSEGTPITLR